MIRSIKEDVQKKHEDDGKQSSDSEDSELKKPRLRITGKYSVCKFKIGQIITHRRYSYRGVIYGYDTECKLSEDWIIQMQVDSLPRGRSQPFYHVLVDERYREDMATYVAEENILVADDEVEVEVEVESEADAAVVRHHSIGKYFTGVQQNNHGGRRYIANPELLSQYPEDYSGL
eukprot:TRINITY_DN2697_c0_g2_i2.p1 TRINITY_DN2697_c0_g2~~TRINITY_DN2697_c0_g2_i2.p1  ORF type:complete len:175 (-),score=40.34 TRINITY_DN2697_c0_g2_i2:245-769(-)